MEKGRKLSLFNQKKYARWRYISTTFKMMRKVPNES